MYYNHSRDATNRSIQKYRTIHPQCKAQS
ncbi:BgTH12-01921 [Blumeria graminis f. sp. triticale]|uniref:BgTH12-01921 n=1 Tax=Blumeria graminis f. sp. triticale TaxID=1689686 RepID=A0A9W4DKU2_BLUGR|nr:BgTH12-01921 [Blumeria graminis f. sp. triticale]